MPAYLLVNSSARRFLMVTGVEGKILSSFLYLMTCSFIKIKRRDKIHCYSEFRAHALIRQCLMKLRDNNQDIKWTIISRARPYNNISKRCDLCLTENLMIITANPDRILNKRSELISKCPHENKFYLRNN